MMELPILWNHDQSKPAGRIVSNKSGVLTIELIEDLELSGEWVWDLGIRVTRREMKDGKLVIRSGEILEISIVPAQPPSADRTPQAPAAEPGGT